MIVLASGGGRKNRQTEAVLIRIRQVDQLLQVSGLENDINRFLRLGLPLILISVFVIIALFVLNAFEATARMEMQGRAGPTILNP